MVGWMESLVNSLVWSSINEYAWMVGWMKSLSLSLFLGGGNTLQDWIVVGSSVADACYFFPPGWRQQRRIRSPPPETTLKSFHPNSTIH